jgi:hypothetical protein
MTNEQRLSTLGLVLAAVIAGLLITSFALGVFGGSSPSPSPGAASASPSTIPSEPASASPSATPAPTDVPSPSPTTTPEQTPSQSAPSSPSADTAAATVMALKLDALDNPDGQDRELHFQAVGDGPVLARVIVHSPRGQAVMCLTTPQQDLGCTTTTDGRLSVDHAGDATDYTLTLRGDGPAAPIVDVAVSFPSNSPELTIANARFDGTEFPDTNGIEVLVTPRAAGNLGLVAEWGGHPFIYEIAVTEQNGSGGETLANQGPATRVDTSVQITPPNPWQLVLQNAEVGFGTTGLNASITWP